MQKKKRGKVIIPKEARPWPHERHIADILASHGYSIEFLAETNVKFPDAKINNTAYEFKFPLTSKADKILRNIKRALKQSTNILIDCSRMENYNYIKIKNILENATKTQPRIDNLILITKSGKIVYIKGHL